MGLDRPNSLTEGTSTALGTDVFDAVVCSSVIQREEQKQGAKE